MQKSNTPCPLDPPLIEGRAAPIIFVGFDAYFCGTCAYEGVPKSCKIRGGDFTDRGQLAAALRAEFPGATVAVV